MTRNKRNYYVNKKILIDSIFTEISCFVVLLGNVEPQMIVKKEDYRKLDKKAYFTKLLVDSIIEKKMSSSRKVS